MLEVWRILNLREFACQLTPSWPLASVEGRARAVLLGQNPVNLVDLQTTHDLQQSRTLSGTQTQGASFACPDDLHDAETCWDLEEIVFKVVRTLRHCNMLEVWRILNLREFACQLTPSWPRERVDGRVWAALLDKNPVNLANPVNSLRIPECVF